MPELTALADQWQKQMVQLRASNVTVVVDGRLTRGAPMAFRHPTDGLFVECAYEDALVIHNKLPLRRVRILSKDRAHFEVAGRSWPFGTFIPLSPPPYAVPGGRDA